MTINWQMLFLYVFLLSGKISIFLNRRIYQLHIFSSYNVNSVIWRMDKTNSYLSLWYRKKPTLERVLSNFLEKLTLLTFYTERFSQVKVEKKRFVNCL